MPATQELKIYLAGPEVFLPNPLAKGADKRAAIARFNDEVLPDQNFRFSGLYPMSAESNYFTEDPPATAMLIFRKAVDLMDAADLIIANVTRFRGPSADVGTAFEMGYMHAQHKPVFAYYSMQETYFTADQCESTVLDRTNPDSDAHTTHVAKVRAFAAGYLVDRTTSKERDNYTHMIENFGLTDNLMIVGAVRSATGGQQGYAPAASFEAALQEAAAYYSKEQVHNRPQSREEAVHV